MLWHKPKVSDRINEAGGAITATGGDGEVVFRACLDFPFDLEAELYLQPLFSQDSTATIHGYECVFHHKFSKGELTVSIASNPGWYIPAFKLHSSSTYASAHLFYCRGCRCYSVTRCSNDVQLGIFVFRVVFYYTVNSIVEGVKLYHLGGGEGVLHYSARLKFSMGLICGKLYP